MKFSKTSISVKAGVIISIVALLGVGAYVLVLPRFVFFPPAMLSTDTAEISPGAPARSRSALKTGTDDPALVKRLSTADNRFGFRLFSQLVDGQEGRNIFYSPYSVSSALTMTYNGATGETQRAMAQVMEISGFTLPDLDRAHAQLATQLLKADPDVHINVANSLWANQTLTFQPDFLRRNLTYFGANVSNVDYSRPQDAADRINGWVSKQTNGKIDKLVEPDSLDSLTALLLVNAVYFQGIWTHPFNPKGTKDGPFTLADGRTVSVPMMHRDDVKEYGYLKGDGFQAVRLPYGVNAYAQNRFAMYIFLPDRPDGLAAWLKGLTAERWDRWLKDMQFEGGSVVLPKFRVEYEQEMSEPLKALGMGIAFDPNRADFRHMIDAQVFIKRVDHKALLDVDEKGTIAAAATSVQMELLSALIVQHPFRLVVDRPFFCAIRDDKTGEVLFMGAVYDPARSGAG